MRLYALILAIMLIVPAIAVSAKPDKAKKSSALKDTTQKEAMSKEAVKEVVKETLIEDAAAKKNENEIKINAVLEVGIDINHRAPKDETDYNKLGYGKIEISARPVRKVRAEFGFEYDTRDSSFIIDKLYGLYNVGEFGSLRIGYMKKVFGHEEKAGLEERYFHRRSIVNGYMEDFHLLGHDLTLQYRHKIHENWRAVGAFSWGQDSTRYYQNYSVEYETPKVNLVLSGVVAHFTRPDPNITAFATSLSFKYLASLFVNEAEVTFGNNPDIKFDKRNNDDDKRNDNENDFVLGARVQEYFPIETGLKTLRQVIPIAEASYYCDNIGDNFISNFDVQARAGLTFGFAKNSAFQWRNTYGQVLRIREKEMNIHRRRFDSEVVVIF